MLRTWGPYADWALRIVREQGTMPIVWHIIIDELGNELEVTQCGDGSGAWVDLDAVNVDGGDLSTLSHLCQECARGLGRFAAHAEEHPRGR